MLWSGAPPQASRGGSPLQHAPKQAHHAIVEDGVSFRLAIERQVGKLFVDHIGSIR
jgi:hypothetical protein